METTQYVIVGIVVVAAVAYLARRAWLSLKGEADPCAGCEGCALKDVKRRSECVRKETSGGRGKKMREKFGDKE